jgi:hypothetical protein
MAKAVTPPESRLNLAIVHTLIEELPKDQSAAVGMNALGELADLLPHEQFVRFIDGAIHHATTGEIPAEEQQASTGNAEPAEPAPAAAAPPANEEEQQQP